MTSVQIRRASPVDAAGIVAVLEAVAAERIHSAIDQVWSVEQEARYLASLSHREALHVAVDAAAGIVGVQSLDRWSSVLSSMAHVGQTRDVSAARLARTGRWPPVVAGHRGVCARGRLSEAGDSGSRLECRRPVVLSRARLHGMRAADRPGHHRRRRGRRSADGDAAERAARQSVTSRSRPRPRSLQCGDAARTGTARPHPRARRHRRDGCPADRAAREPLRGRLGSADNRRRLARASRRRAPARHGAAPALHRSRRRRRRGPGLGVTRGRPRLRRSRQRRGRRGLRAIQSGRAGRAHAGGGGRAARTPAATRPDGAGGLRGELGRRDDVTELVRPRPRADRTLAPSAADPAGPRPPRDHDPGALPSGARLLHAGAAPRLSRRGRAARHRRRDTRRRRGGRCLAAHPCRRSLDAHRRRRRRPDGAPDGPRRRGLAAVHQGNLQPTRRRRS